MIEKNKKHIVLIVPRGEAVRNFLYSDTIKVLSKNARVTVLSVVDDPDYTDKFKDYAEQVIKLDDYPEKPFHSYIGYLIFEAHFKYLKSQVALNYLERKKRKEKKDGKHLKLFFTDIISSTFANNTMLRWLTKFENSLTLRSKSASYYFRLFKELQPDLIFNTSHIHGLAGEWPAKIASRMGIPVAGFVFSWDNLTSRSRITVPYDYYFVWGPIIKSDLLRIYPFVKPENVFVTGTPQFDYHFKDEFSISLNKLAETIGFDSKRPYILYTTGIDSHFPEEHLHVEKVIEIIRNMPAQQKPQLVVRTYVKGTSKEMYAIRDRNIPDVFFPKVEWEETLFTPSYNDLSIYSSLLKYAALGINVASTVTLELFIFGIPVVNLGFDPVGSNIDPLIRYERHILFDHFKPVADSGGSAVAYNNKDLKKYIEEAFTEPRKRTEAQRNFLKTMFGDALDGHSADRIGKLLLNISSKENS